MSRDCPFAAAFIFFLCGISSVQLTLMPQTCLSFMMLRDEILYQNLS